MSDTNQDLAARLAERFGAAITDCTVARGEVTAVVDLSALHDVCLALRDEAPFNFEQLIDLCGVDYYEYGMDEEPWQGPRFAVVYHLLSVSRNRRLRVRALLDDAMPRIATVCDVWSSANWYEREAFDLFGFMFDGHPDLRRILTDYGFIGHPFRKDFPLIGNVEMRYDPDRRRVVYEPVSIDMRVTVPRVIRHDSRYEAEAPSPAGDGDG